MTSEPELPRLDRGPRGPRRTPRGLIPAGAILALALAALLVSLLSSGTDETPTTEARVATRTIVGASGPVTVLGADAVQTVYVKATATAPRRQEEAVAPAALAADPGQATQQSAFRRALGRAVAKAHHLGGRAQVGIWVEGWAEPLVAGDDPDTPMRMWSMSKPITAVATRLAAHDRPSAELTDAMQDAITQSNNCAQRRVVRGLQTLSGSTPAARAAFEQVLRTAGAVGVRVGDQVARAEQECEAYLGQHSAGVADPMGPALLLGTSTWTTRDAVSFARALANRTFGDAGRAVTALMTLPKARDPAAPADAFTAPLDWGAGTALAQWSPAYKAGWGGASTKTFLAGQLAALTVGGRAVAVAAMFHPHDQPPNDDPGQTRAPEALAAMFGAIARELRAM